MLFCIDPAIMHKEYPLIINLKDMDKFYCKTNIFHIFIFLLVVILLQNAFI